MPTLNFDAEVIQLQAKRIYKLYKKKEVREAGILLINSPKRLQEDIKIKVKELLKNGATD